MYQQTTTGDPDDDEIMVYDWERGIPRLTGTARLPDPPVRVVPKSQPVPNNFLSYSNFSSFGSSYPRFGQPSIQHSYHPTSPGSGYHSYNQPQQYSYTDSHDYNHPSITPTQYGAHQQMHSTPNYVNSASHYPTSWDCNAVNTNSQIFGQSTPTYFEESHRQTHRRDSDWLEVEEIDYSQGTFAATAKASTSTIPTPHNFPSLMTGGNSHHNYSPVAASSLASKTSLPSEFEEFDYSNYGSQSVPAELVPDTTTKSKSKKGKRVQFSLPTPAGSKTCEPEIEAEEIDHSRIKSNDQSLKKDNRRQSKTEHKSKSDKSKSGPGKLDKHKEKLKLPPLAVPKPDLPLCEVFPQFPVKPKSKHLKAVTNSRKRSIDESEKSDASDLEGLLSKIKHRVSARSYAKPTRRVDPIASSVGVAIVSDEKSPLYPSVPIQNSNLSNNSSPVRSSDSGENKIFLSTMDNDYQECSDRNFGITNSPVCENSLDEDSSGDEDFTEPLVKIRTDIFEEEEDEDEEGKQNT